MRDPEFLPAWYPTLRRRRRLIALQGWMVLVVLAGLGLWMLLAGRNVRAAQGSLTNLDVQLRQTDSELQKLNELLALQKQWQHQDDIAARLGPYVPAARLLAALSDAMPREMALLDLAMAVTEVQKQQPAMVIVKDKDSAAAVDRHLRVTLTAVAPTDVEVGNFLAKLTSVPWFDDVEMGYDHERLQNGHVMREFTVSMTIDLNGSPDRASN